MNDFSQLVKAAIETDMGKLMVERDDLAATVKAMREALAEAGDVIESYYENTGIDLGDASNMPFYRDTITKIDTALARHKEQPNG